MMAASAQAQPNIALIKYWGKRDVALNLPAAGSLSLTIDALWTRTRVEFDPDLEADTLLLNDTADPLALARVSACLDVLRAHAGTALRARVASRNNFPTAAGLASSASGFAALVMAAAKALGLDADRRMLSIVARQGSGSAARSLYGGIVLMHPGRLADGSDAYAEPLLQADAWPLDVVVAVVTREPKATSSGEGMRRSERTSPFYASWTGSVAGDLAAARAAVEARDFKALGELAEYNCLKMHAVMLSSRPPLMYWSEVTVACMERVRQLREREGRNVFFTIDAGPQLKAVCLPEDTAAVQAALAAVPGVETVMCSALGEGARCLPDLAA